MSVIPCPTCGDRDESEFWVDETEPTDLFGIPRILHHSEPLGGCGASWEIDRGEDVEPLLCLSCGGVGHEWLDCSALLASMPAGLHVLRSGGSAE